VLCIKGEEVLSHGINYLKWNSFKEEDKKLDGGTNIVNLPVSHDLNNGKIVQPQFFLSAQLCLRVTWSG
jgi:hypothetical protein